MDDGVHEWLEGVRVGGEGKKLVGLHVVVVRLVVHRLQRHQVLQRDVVVVVVRVCSVGIQWCREISRLSEHEFTSNFNFQLQAPRNGQHLSPCQLWWRLDYCEISCHCRESQDRTK